MLRVLWRNWFEEAGLGRCYAVDFGTVKHRLTGWCFRLVLIFHYIRVGNLEALQLGINTNELLVQEEHLLLFG